MIGNLLDGALLLAGAYGWAAAGVWAWRCALGRISRHRILQVSSRPAPPEAPLVSVLVPARNEEANIAECLEGLLAQDYPRIEVIAIDDNSSDRTGELIARASKRDPRLRAERAPPTPPGWTGKNRALAWGAERARGEWLLFTDADTRHGPWALSSAMVFAMERNLDVLSLIPRALTLTFAEKVLQPAAMGYLGRWFPLDRVNDPTDPTAFANGQFLLLKRSAYDALGGHSAVREAYLEDVALARAAKRRGLRLECALGKRLLGVRMYDSLPRYFRGWRRIYLHAFDRRPRALLSRALDLAALSVLPFGLPVVTFAYSAGSWAGATVAEILAGLGTVLPLPLIYLFAGKVHSTLRAGRAYALFHPFAAAVLVGVLLDAARAARAGAPTPWR